MSIIKNEIPILEFDNNFDAMINPPYDQLEFRLPSKCVYAFVGDYIDEYAKKCNAKLVTEFVNATKRYPIYIVNYKGEEVTFCQAPVGAPVAVQIMDWLIGYGVREIISTGSCGGLLPLPEGKFLVPYKALRDEGTSYHYVAPSRFIETNLMARRAIEKTISEHGIEYQEVVTWTTDGFFRETKELVEYRKNEGCQVVEMECSALAACAAFRKATFGIILYTADSLADIEKYDERNWGGNAYEYALSLCFDSVLKL